MSRDRVTAAPTGHSDGYEVGIWWIPTVPGQSTTAVSTATTRNPASAGLGSAHDFGQSEAWYFSRPVTEGPDLEFIGGSTGHVPVANTGGASLVRRARSTPDREGDAGEEDAPDDRAGWWRWEEDEEQAPHPEAPG